MRRASTRLLLGVWGTAVITGGASLMINHLVAMPAPSDTRAVEAWLGSWTLGNEGVIHVIPHQCSCTTSLFQHLIERGPLPGLDEHILVSGSLPDLVASARGAGFTTHLSSPAELARRGGMRAGPVMVRLDAAGQLIWIGGYYDGPGLDRPLDVKTLSALGRGHRPEALPLFGCAIDPLLRDQQDPLGIRWLLGF